MVSSITSKSVMIVDDDIRRRRRIYEVLKITGFDIFSAANGDQALAALPRNKPSLVVVNTFSPSVAGSDFIRRLRSYGMGQKMIVVALHANNEEEVKAARLAGIDGLLVDGFAPYALVDLICRFLKIDKIRIPEGEFKQRRQVVEDLAESYRDHISRDSKSGGVQLLLPDGRDLGRLLLTEDAGRGAKG